MTWANGGVRGRRIPDRVKRQVRARDQTCQLGYPGCTEHIDEFDHIDGIAVSKVERVDANTAEHLRGVCAPCHKQRTQQQAQAGRQRGKRQPRRHPSDV